MRPASALIVLALATSARAHSVTDEIIVSSGQSTETNPRPTVFTDSLNASFDLGGDWTLNGGVSLTLQGSTGAAASAGFNQSSNPAAMFTGGVDWWADDHWLLGLTLDLSPQNTQFAVATNPATTSTSAVDAQVQSQTSQIGAALDLSWYSAGHSDLEWSFNAGFGFSHSSIRQSIVAVRTATGQTLTADEFSQAFCAAHPRIRNCAQNLNDALNGTEKPLDVERFSAGATATIRLDTDVSLFADYYVYNQDPGLLDYRVAALPFGAGMPIAPLQYMIRPEVQHRFGDLSLKLWAEGGEYVSGTAQSTVGIGAKVQYRFNRAFRAWISGSGHRDVDDRGASTGWGTVAGGLGYRW